MANVKASKRHKEWGRRLRGSAKARRSGPTGRKKRRKMWFEDSQGKKFELPATRTQRWGAMADYLS